ncbi:MAG: hypothetical protein IJE25_06790 [Clostridia bacterium]|nr:hypothetical protein [Clostridia bacterium]
MTKRRSIIAAFLIVALLAVGIGYAALTDTLTVTGSAGFAADDAVETFDGDVYFSKALGDATRVDARVLADADTAVMHVVAGTLKQVGDEVIATFTIKSESDLTVAVTPTVSADTSDPSYTLNDSYFSVYTNLTGEQTLAAGGTIDFTVTVKLIKTNETQSDISCNFVVSFDVQSK